MNQQQCSTGTDYLRRLARGYFDVAAALLDLKGAKDAAGRMRALAALQILVPIRPRGWTGVHPRYSAVEATIASRTVTSQGAVALFRQIPKIILHELPPHTRTDQDVLAHRFYVGPGFINGGRMVPRTGSHHP